MADLQMGGGNHEGAPRERLVCDFIASMTDRYAMNLYANLFFPSPFTQKVN
jgi:dGTPase